jgi:hypothetical protein
MAIDSGSHGGAAKQAAAHWTWGTAAFKAPLRTSSSRLTRVTIPSQ